MGYKEITIGDIIERAGGVMFLAQRYGYTSTQGVQYWKQRGVRRDLIEDVAMLAGVSEATIRELNKAGSAFIRKVRLARQKKLKKGKAKK